MMMLKLSHFSPLKILFHRTFFSPSRSLLTNTPGTSNTPNKKFTIPDTEISEKFIRSAKGPGGQKINKSASCVSLTHIPTNTRVKCHETRSLEANRKIAKKKLLEIVELKVLGTESKVFKKAEEKRVKWEKREKKREERVRKKYENKGDEEKVKSLKEQIWEEKFNVHLSEKKL